MSSKSKKQPLRRRVTIYTSDEPIAALEEAQEELAAAERDATAGYERRIALARSANPPASELLRIEESLHSEREQALEPARKAVTVAEDAVRDSAEHYVFRGIGSKAFQDLMAEHEPTDADHDRTRKMMGRAEALAMWRQETFEPALVAACCIGAALTEKQADKLMTGANTAKTTTGPALTVAEAAEFRDEWSDDEWQQLFDAAYIVSRGSRRVDLGKGSRAVTKPA